MKVAIGSSRKTTAFTLVEILVTCVVAGFIMAAAMKFMIQSSQSFSGVATQSLYNAQAAQTLEFIQSRLRFATFISTATNTLTIGLDDDYTTDSDGDKITYNDRDHYEQFKFIGVNSTNAAYCAGNSIVYIPNTNSPNIQRVMIAAGVRNLPNCNIFSVTNIVIVVIRFGVAAATPGSYESIDVQGTGLSLNRLWNTNVLSIFP